MILKVLESNMESPYQGFIFEVGKEYACSGFDPNPNMDCSRGFYATDIEGLPYAYRPGRRVFEAEVGGGNVNYDIYKRRWETIKLVRELDVAEIKALAEAHESVCRYKLSEALFPINPFLLPKRKPSKEDIALLKEWASVVASVGASVSASVVASVGASVSASVVASVGASVLDSVRASVLDSVRASVLDSVWASVWESVWAYTGSLFPNIKKWKYINHKPGVYPFQCGADLWRRGLVPSYDGRVWRLHSGKNGAVVWGGA